MCALTALVNLFSLYLIWTSRAERELCTSGWVLSWEVCVRVCRCVCVPAEPVATRGQVCQLWCYTGERAGTWGPVSGLGLHGRRTHQAAHFYWKQKYTDSYTSPQFYRFLCWQFRNESLRVKLAKWRELISCSMSMTWRCLKFQVLCGNIIKNVTCLCIIVSLRMLDDAQQHNINIRLEIFYNMRGFRSIFSVTWCSDLNKYGSKYE